MIIAVIRIGISKFVRNADAVAPIVPNVEIIANPIGPQLHAPAAEPTKEPNTLPLIFFVDLLRTVMR